jgi:hypothetical protein
VFPAIPPGEASSLAKSEGEGEDAHGNALAGGFIHQRRETRSMLLPLPSQGGVTTTKLFSTDELVSAGTQRFASHDVRFIDPLVSLPSSSRRTQQESSSRAGAQGSHDPLGSTAMSPWPAGWLTLQRPKLPISLGRTSGSRLFRSEVERPRVTFTFDEGLAGVGHIARWRIWAPVQPARLDSLDTIIYLVLKIEPAEFKSSKSHLLAQKGVMGAYANESTGHVIIRVQAREFAGPAGNSVELWLGAAE